MLQKNGTAGAPRRKSEAIQEDIQALNKIIRRGEAIDRAVEVPSFGTLLAQFGTERFDSPQQEPGPVPWDALTNSWLGDALRWCVKENRPNVVKLLLWKMLFTIGATDVVDEATYKAFEATVFKPFPHIGTGRRVDINRDFILKTWRELGEPPLSRFTLAQKVYGITFERASTEMRMRLRDRCRQTVKRALEAERKRRASPHIDIETSP